MRFLKLAVFLVIPIISFTQNKIPLSHLDYNLWETTKSQQISNNGFWISYELTHFKGDGKLELKNPEKKIELSFDRGYSAVFSSNSNFIAFKVKPQEDTLHLQKFKKVKKDNQAKDSLFIVNFNNNLTAKFANIKMFSVPKENSEIVAFLNNKEQKQKAKKIIADTLKADSLKLKDTTKVEKPIEKKIKKSKNEGTDFFIYYPNSNDTIHYKNVSEYSLDQFSKYVSFISIEKDSLDSAKVFLVDAKTKKQTQIFNKQGTAKNIIIDKLGKNLSFIFTSDTLKLSKYELYLYSIVDKKLSLIVDTFYNKFPKNYDLSPDRKPYFSENSENMYFGIRKTPEKEVKDSLLDEDRCKVDVWSWTDNNIIPEQLKNLDEQKKLSYITLYNLKTRKIVQLGDSIIENVKILNKGNNKYAIGVVSEKYAKSSSWDIPQPKDYYLINTKTGEKKIILTQAKSGLYISPNETFLYWYNVLDSNWYAMPINAEIPNNITKNINSKFYEQENDVPNLPDNYGFAGWFNNDKFIFVYDEFDIWKIDPNNIIKPENVTNGRKEQNRFRYYKFDEDNKFIENTMFLNVFNKKTKQSGYFSYNTTENKLSKIIIDDFDFTVIEKAKNSEKYIWRKMSFTRAPEIEYGNPSLNNNFVATNLTKQQNKFIWGTVEKVNWVSLAGDSLQGLLYKPENFDTSLKYPMIVYFYEKYSDEIHNYYSPKPSRSVINFTYYVSNGYLVFVPDIKYGVGHPGNDCYNSVVSGTTKLLENKWIDSTKLGLQGQSWGGYQVAYLVTRTNMFAAAMAGAPVSNMTSAYGGIRWEAGISRMFQYEKAQSRIGKTLWEGLDLYMENSPLFFSDKVNTPLLIMHNDNDGAVPWYQGIEYFMALRRLNKPVWLLNYNGDNHNLTKEPNMVDLSIRTSQFFDYYLKNKPAAKWLVNGVKSVDKEKVTMEKLLKDFWLVFTIWQNKKA